MATLAALETAVGGGAVLMVDADGGIAADRVTGLYVGDRRLVSRLETVIAGHHREVLQTTHPGPDRIVTHAVLVDDAGRQRALLSDARHVAGALTIDLTIRALEATETFEIVVTLATDLADLLSLRYDGSPPPPKPYRLTGEGLMVRDGPPGVAISAPGAHADPEGRLTWTVTVSRGRARMVSLTVRPTPTVPSVPLPPTTLRVSGDQGWTRSVGSALADVRALRMHDPDSGLSWPAAGAPWYMAMFGRDALLTAYEALIAGTGMALDSLEALARFQGDTDDPATGEAPGKVLHELRTGSSGVFDLPPWQPYYGSVDATPLFVILLAEAHRWGADRHRVAALLPAARRAISWCRRTSAIDTRRHLTYGADPNGLVNQGWKDFPDSMVHADGSVAAPPIAVVEAQGYHWQALLGLAELETSVGDQTAAPRLRAEAARVRRRVLDDFVSHEDHVVAMALDAHGSPLEVASSNAGHLLWVGLLDGRHARRLADRLTAPDMHAGWGLRTLSSAAAAYNPLSYHCGSVWPHDTALVVDGLARAGRTRAAATLVDGLLRLAEHVGWRLPELVCGLGADEADAPVPYPVACSPQAWSAAAPLLLLRTTLRLDPDVPAGRVSLGPVLQDDLTLDVRGIRLGAHRLDVSVDRGHITARIDPPIAVTIHR